MATPLPVHESERRAGVHRQRERRKAGLIADVFRDVLVQGDGVAERTAGRVRRCRQKADVRWMAAVYVRMRHAGEDGEVLAVFFKNFEVVGRCVVDARLRGEELARQHTEVVANREHAPRRGSRLRAHGRDHRVQKRQPQANADAAQKRAAGNGGLRQHAEFLFIYFGKDRSPRSHERYRGLHSPSRAPCPRLPQPACDPRSRSERRWHR
jgi:hypothetical protein